MSKSMTGPSPTARPNSKKAQNKKTQSKNPQRSSSQGTNAPQRKPSGGRTASRAAAGSGGAPPRGRTAAGATFRSRHPVLTALVPLGLVVAAIATMVVIKAAGSPGSSGGASHVATSGAAATAHPTTTALAPSVTAALSVPASTLDAVGSPAGVSPPTRVGGNGTVLRGADGKPLITYVGAEYCPYCAAERWALAVALSRFGTFSNLSGTHSSGSDVYPNTQTLSFYGSSYASPYVDFQGVEEASNQQVGGQFQTLQTPTAAQRSLMSTYDSGGSIPFLDIANKYVITGASYSPQVLQGLSRAQIAAQLGDPASPVAQAIDGTANYITAAISKVTGNQPSTVAGSSAVASIAKRLGA